MKTTPRPICVHCGKRYGQRATHCEVVRWMPSEPKPEYAGNGIVIQDRYHGIAPNRTVLLGVEVTGMHSAYRWIWDGETWWAKYTPFCSLRCALDFARKAYAKGVRL